MKINIKTLLKNKNGMVNNTYKAILKDNYIIYNDLNCLIKVDLNGIIIRENKEFCLILDFINQKYSYLLKETNTKLNLKVNLNKIKKDDKSFKVKYSIEDETVEYELEVIK